MAKGIAIRRNNLGRILAFALCIAVVFAADAQPTTKALRVGWLGAGSPPPPMDKNTGQLQQGLRDLGYVEGRNLTIEYRYAGGNVDRLPELATELLRLNVDVIVTAGEPAAFAAKRATNLVPIVATEYGLDPVAAGLVTSLARPGGNLTGLATISEELWQKRLAMLKEIAPKSQRFAVLWNPSNPGNASCLKEIQSSARALGISLRPLEVRDARSLERAFADMAKDTTDALVACWDSVTLELAPQIAEFALKRKLPTTAEIREYAQAGFLFSFGMSLSTHRRRSAYYVDRIAKGAKPADLPIERPTLFELVINGGTARALGLVIPAAIGLQADEVFP